MRIHPEMGYTYDDLLIVPKFSTVMSRSDVDTSVTLGTLSLKIPIIAANMDTICEWNMAEKMHNLGGLGILHRFAPIEQQVEWVKYLKSKNCYAVPSVGVGQSAFADAQRLLEAGADGICLDVAHGHSVYAANLSEKLSPLTPNLIVGNLATADSVRFYADKFKRPPILKVGIGPGCFTPEMEVLTTKGPTPISQIELGDKVISHNGTINRVIHKFEYDRDEEIMVINGIQCTKNHEFYVLNKKYKDIVTEDTVEQFAEWVEAQFLTKDYLLLDVA